MSVEESIPVLQLGDFPGDEERVNKPVLNTNADMENSSDAQAARKELLTQTSKTFFPPRN